MSNQDFPLPIQMFEPDCRSQNLVIAASDPLVQAASNRLSSQFLVFTAAAALALKNTNEKTRFLQSLAERNLLDAIKLELLAMRTHAEPQSACLELPAELLNLRVS